MGEALKVGLIGLNDKNVAKLEKIFLSHKDDPRSYSISSCIEESDLFIVAVNDPGNFNRDAAVPSCSVHKPVITQGMSEKPNGADFHIKGVLLANRVIGVLDQVDLTAAYGADESEMTVDESSNDESGENVFAQTVFKVLVVDDSELMRKTLAHEMESASVQIAVDFAETGEQALQKVSENRYDFMFLDVMMPGIDGYETCQKIRTMDGMAKTPIIMLSGKTSPLDEVQGIISGCTSYLTKPIRSEEFQNMLDRVMDWLANYRE